MAVTYNGIRYTKSAFDQQGPPTFRRMDGYSQSVVKFKGPTGAAAAFISELEGRRFPTINFFGRPVYTANYAGYDADDGPVWTTISIFFDVGGIVQEPKSVTSLSAITVSVPVSFTQIIGASSYQQSGDLTIQFKAPETTWEWFESKSPKDVPRYSSIISKANPWQNIIFASMGGGSGVVPAAKTVLDYIIENGRDAVVERLVNYEYEELIKGSLWHCKSTHARTIEPAMAAIELIS